MTPDGYLLMALGSALGAMARYLVNLGVAEALGTRFPWGTLAVNLSGALLLGLLVGLPGFEPGSDRWLLFVIGLCGSYTTVSAFSLHCFDLIRIGRPLAAAANVAASTLGCLAAVWTGLTLSAVLRGVGA